MPTIACWPGKIPKGTTSAHVGYFGDFMATAAELARIKPPTGLDSLSFLPTLLGRPNAQKQHEFLYWEYHGGRASSQAILVDGRWKGLRNERRSAPLEIFDLQSDLGEERNVAGKHPDIVARMETCLRNAREDSANWPLRDAPATKKAAK